MLENPIFEQNHYSIISTGFYKNAHDSVSLMNRYCYYNRSHYEIFTYYDLMGSILSCLNEKS